MCSDQLFRVKLLSVVRLQGIAQGHSRTKTELPSNKLVSVLSKSKLKIFGGGDSGGLKVDIPQESLASPARNRRPPTLTDLATPLTHKRSNNGSRTKTIISPSIRPYKRPPSKKGTITSKSITPSMQRHYNDMTRDFQREDLEDESLSSSSYSLPPHPHPPPFTHHQHADPIDYIPQGSRLRKRLQRDRKEMHLDHSRFYRRSDGTLVGLWREIGDMEGQEGDQVQRFVRRIARVNKVSGEVKFCKGHSFDRERPRRIELNDFFLGSKSHREEGPIPLKQTRLSILYRQTKPICKQEKAASTKLPVVSPASKLTPSLPNSNPPTPKLDKRDKEINRSANFSQYFTTPNSTPKASAPLLTTIKDRSYIDNHGKSKNKSARACVSQHGRKYSRRDLSSLKNPFDLTESKLFKISSQPRLLLPMKTTEKSENSFPTSFQPHCKKHKKFPTFHSTKSKEIVDGTLIAEGSLIPEKKLPSKKYKIDSFVKIKLKTQKSTLEHDYSYVPACLYQSRLNQMSNSKPKLKHN